LGIFFIDDRRARFGEWLRRHGPAIGAHRGHSCAIQAGSRNLFVAGGAEVENDAARNNNRIQKFACP
jgi:hypothetical protein